MLRIFILVLSLSLGLWASATTPVGTIIQLRGEVYNSPDSKEERKLWKLNEPLQEKDQFFTAPKSFVKIQMLDNTLINIGPDSHFVIDKVFTPEGKRDSFYQLAVGKMRAHIQKKAKEDESLVFKAGSIPLGVRGTEFLTAVTLGEKTVTDAIVLSGKISAGETLISEGQVYNSEKGIWKTLSSDELKVIRDNPDSFFEEKKEADAIEKTKSPSAPQTSTVTIIEKHYVELVKSSDKELPWDIKEALKLREKYKKENHCFYWEYKLIPGSYVPQRFRRERDCDDYQEGR